MDLLSTAWTFAAMHASMTDSAIQCWRLKRDLGYLRPHEAITGSVDDGNPATVVEAGWTPLVTPVPNYADYVSGHACLTSPQVGVIREVLGEDTALELRSANGPPRVYTKARAHRARRVLRAHLVGTPLRRRDGRRLPHRARHRGPRDGGAG